MTPKWFCVFSCVLVGFGTHAVAVLMSICTVENGWHRPHWFMVLIIAHMSTVVAVNGYEAATEKRL